MGALTVTVGVGSGAVTVSVVSVSDGAVSGASGSSGVISCPEETALSSDRTGVSSLRSGSSAGVMIGVLACSLSCSGSDALVHST